MNDDIRRLLRAADRLVREAEALSGTFSRALAGVLRDTERRLLPLLRDATQGSPSAIIRAAQANRVRKDIRQALTLSGYDALAEASTDGFDTMVQRVLAGRELAQLSADLTPRRASQIEALKSLYALDLLDEADAVSKALWRAMVRGVFGSRPAPDILAQLGQVLDRSESQIQTLYDTSVSIFGRQVEAVNAGDDPETKFMYAHPVDAKTRPFCLKHAGKVYTREHIDSLDNGQLPDVFLTGGGYNCRGQWMEVSRFSELYDYDTRDRVPEVQEDIDAIKKAA